MRLHNPAITGSLTVSGSKIVDFTDATRGLTLTNITASGNISASGTINAEQLTTSDDLTVGDQAQALRILVNPDQEATGDFRVKSENLNHVLYTDANKDKVGIGWHNPAGAALLSSLHINVGRFFRKCFFELQTSQR